jgi:flagellar motor protein MotB
MAEIMLLLVFCLLFATTVALLHEHDRRISAETRLSEVIREKGNDRPDEGPTLSDVQAYRTLTEKLKRYPPLSELANKTLSAARQQEIDEAWRRLVEGAEVSDELSRKGIDASTAKRDADLFAEAERIKNEGLDIKELQNDARFANAIRKQLADDNIPVTATSDIATLAKEGYLARREKLPRALNESHKWPPIISLSEAGGYYFEIGSAELKLEFKEALTNKVVPKILDIAAQYPDVNVIEVVGHTDEQPIKRPFSNMDEAILGALRNGDVASLVPADNAGLGLARAVSVVTRLLREKRLERFSRILPLSGAQLIQVDERLTHGAAGDVRERRRIEIRLRKHESSILDSSSRKGGS